MKNLKRIRKGYEIDFSKIEEGYLASGESCTAISIGKAKYTLLDKIKYEGWKLKYSTDEITFTNIPVKRCHIADVYEFEGEEVPMYRIDEILDKRKRFEALDKILNDDQIKFCYIEKRGYYYKPDSCGYTSRKSEAGIYTKEEAVSDAKSCSELYIIPVDISAHNEMIDKGIKELKNRLILEPV